MIEKYKGSLLDVTEGYMGVIKTTEYVGSYRIGSTSFYLEKKPFIIHRFFMRFILGVRWLDS